VKVLETSEVAASLLVSGAVTQGLRGRVCEVALMAAPSGDKSHVQSLRFIPLEPFITLLVDVTL